MLGRQVFTLHKKTLRITLLRRWFSTFFRAFLLPVIFTAFISYARNLFIPPATYGVGTPAHVRDLSNALSAHPDLKLVFVTNDLGGEVQDLVDGLLTPLRSAGRNVVTISDPLRGLQQECKQSLRGSSDCFAAVVFNGSPERGGIWNYTLRGDSSFDYGRINTENHDNPAQEFLLPLQLALDKAIASRANSGSADNVQIDEYMYTDMTSEERDEQIRVRYMTAITDYISIAIFLSHVGIIYHHTGFQATERERGISTLLEAMGVSKAARLISYHLSFSSLYIAGWVVMGFTIGNGVFANTNIGIIIVWYLLTGWACASWSIFASSFFKRAQLSGISTTIVTLIFGIIAQVLNKSSTGAVAVLGLLFPSCNFVFMAVLLGRFEKERQGASLLRAPPNQESNLPGIALFVFLIVQGIGYIILGALVEKSLYSTSGSDHKPTTDPANAVELRGFTKRYVPSFIGNILSGGRKETVTAVDRLDLNIRQGQVLVLLGANGSGKTTTLEAISGLSKVTEGEILINAGGNGHIGICPQKNVFWDELTVEEHVRYWNKLKSSGDTKEELARLIAECDLTPKKRAFSRNLSGGQKRKLQLAIMFTGGSNICAIDEVSSGLDPLSRRKIWDIILRARGERTIILTTHFLDEADLLADDIAVLSRGTLKCRGSAVELKNRLGGGYRVHLPTCDGPELEGVPTKRLYDQTVYNVPDSSAAGRVVDALEAQGTVDYTVNGPTIEDVFLKVAEETSGLQKDAKEAQGEGDDGVELFPGKRLGIVKQTFVMFRKRLTILRRNYFPIFAATVIPIIAVGVTMIFLKGYDRATCSNADTISRGDTYSLTFDVDLNIVLGPREAISGFNISSYIEGDSSSSNGITVTFNDANISFVNTFPDFTQYIRTNYSDVSPGGFFINNNSDTQATYAYLGNRGIRNSMIVQNVVNNLVFGQRVSASYAEFDIPWRPEQGLTLQFLVYTGLVFSVFPAFFALYPTLERIRNVRALHYSNGVRALPLWLAYLLFDFVFILIVSVIASIIMVTSTGDIWYNFGYLFLVIVLYGIASILLAYNVSLVAKSQLSAFAFVAGGQAVMFLLYFIAVMSVFTYAPTSKIDEQLNIVHFAIAAISPISNFTRAVFVALNIFSVSCRGEQYAGNPGGMTLYGGPITYLILQSIFLFCTLLWWDSGRFRLRFGSRTVKTKDANEEEQEVGTLGGEKKFIGDEMRRVDSSNDGLRVMHITKTFGKKVTAVDDVTFGVPRGEVFALLGPNGAGKTTTINMIRGDMVPNTGDIFVENISVTGNRPAARSHLGVCPQFDAMDRMTVEEHLRFYARVRGVEDVEHNVAQVIKAVGLEAFKKRMAENLSGGNKRKLSLGIALMGNPTVLLLDEPSSGMDAASKRIMWKTLAGVTRGRSLVLTTHSMEEADALASRAGILAKSMLAMGTGDQLRRRWGDGYHVHLVLRSAPASTPEEMERLKGWVLTRFTGARVEDRSFHGQMRFSVPIDAEEDEAEADDEGVEGMARKGNSRGVNRVFKALEKGKEGLGLEFYSVSQSTLDQVFLTIVGNANVSEEGYGKPEKKRWWKSS
ncbi:uncharacterized protein H6S33_005572 [Morchella sextelata]|uniref:uncharacterized protein n=1 Tax=Morchella sextelata TaxID=1174677 RepID=UPI001D038DDD|nr:uncharacterized protein H6S33_005572 [Morchella sextelata]KAH0613686.1 hypothetical protein H6S33_005572 [Morchella sextelata]